MESGLEKRELLRRSNKAVVFFQDAHDSIDHKRKYTGEPYWTHTMSVARILRDSGCNDNDIIIAALGHDVLEDVYPKNSFYSPSKIREVWGDRVAELILELTDKYTKSVYPNLNHDERKILEAHRISKISYDAQLIKLADLIDNTSSIVRYDPDFAKVYLKQKQYILGLMQTTAREHKLYKHCADQIQTAVRDLE
jgi:guanosine-3',5'-bis(diphosphate) 3'-pyrophosphohydrolase